MLACQHCGKAYLDYETLYLIDLMRHICGFSFPISSGYRCPVHNTNIQGDAESSHMLGFAFDIDVPTFQRARRIVEVGIFVGMPRIEIAPAHAHLDRNPDKTPDILWPGKSK